MALNYVNLTVDLYDGQGNPLTQGVVTFTPSAMLLDPGVEMVPTVGINVALRVGGPPVVKLLATDNAGISPPGWGWVVTYSNVPGNPPQQTILLPFASGSNQFLSSQASVPVVTSNVSAMPLPSGSANAGYLPFATGSGNASAWASPATTLLDSTATDIAQLATAGTVGSTGKFADAGHAHADPNPLPADFGWLAWNGDPMSAGNTNPLVAGTVYAYAIFLRVAALITNLAIQVTSAGSGLTSGQNFVGLYDATGVQRGITADQTANWAGSGSKIVAMTAQYAAAVGKYYVLILANGTTPPTLRAFSGLGNIVGGNFGLSGANLRSAVVATGQTALPGSFTPSALSSTGAGGAIVAVS